MLRVLIKMANSVGGDVQADTSRQICVIPFQPGSNLTRWLSEGSGLINGQLDVSYFLEGKNLTDAQKVVDKDQDFWRDSLTRVLPFEELRAIGYAFDHPDLSRYADVQLQKWILPYEAFAALNTQTHRSHSELTLEFACSEHSPRFRLWYITTEPENTCLSAPGYKRIQSAADDFLYMAEQISPEKTPFRHIILNRTYNHLHRVIKTAEGAAQVLEADLPLLNDAFKQKLVPLVGLGVQAKRDLEFFGQLLGPNFGVTQLTPVYQSTLAA